MAARKYARPQTLSMVMTRHRWVWDLFEKQSQVEEIVGVQLGDILGCGYYGCVVDAEGPWVVKFTVDPTEGPVWGAIDDIVSRYVDEAGFYLAAWPRVMDVIQIEPGVTVEGADRTLYAIVREEAVPVFGGEPGVPVFSTEPTLLHVGMTRKMIETGYDPVAAHLRTTSSYIEEFVASELTDMIGMKVGKRKAAEIARNVHSLVDVFSALQPYRSTGQRAREIWFDYDQEGEREAGDALRAFVDERGLAQVLNVTEPLLDNKYGFEMAELLRALAYSYIVLADVHVRNVGWRVYETIDKDKQPRCMMVIDPGATPTTQRTTVERRMISNGRWRG